MALGSLPPWLQINPSDYLRATQAGVQAGHAIADSTQRAWEQQQQMQMDQQKLEEAAAEKRQQQGALSQYRAAQLAERERGLGLQEQGLKQRTQGAAERLSLAELRAADSEKFRDLAHTVRQGNLERLAANDKLTHELAQARLDLAKQKVSPQSEYTAQQADILSSHIKDLQKHLADPLTLSKQKPGMEQELMNTGFLLRKLYSPADAAPATEPPSGAIPMSPTAQRPPITVKPKTMRYVRDKATGMLVPESE